MRTVYSERHRLQDGKAELIDGKLLPCFEKPERAELIIARVREVGLGPVLAPRRAWPGAAAAGPRRAVSRFSRRRLGCMGRRARRLRRAAAVLADPEPAPDRAGIDRRQAVLLLVRCRHADHRRHLAGGAASADVALTGAGLIAERRRARGLRAVPAARPPCRARLLRRLLLPQQRRDRRPGAARPGRRAGRDPRRRLPPRQRHPGDLLRARPTCSSSRSTATRARSSRSSSGMPTRPGPGPARAQPQLPAALGHRLRGAGRRRSTTPAGRSRRSGPTRWSSRSASTRSRAIRSRASGCAARTSPASARGSRRSRCRPCS